MLLPPLQRFSLCLVLCCLFTSVASAQFKEDFDTALKKDSTGTTGWAFFTGDGFATMDFKQAGGLGILLVDATQDRENIWWALIKRDITKNINLRQLSKPHNELQPEARIKVSHAPKRVNLSVNSQRTTDFHSDLMEFYIEDTINWHTISFTTTGFDASPGDTVFAQLALMDWGLEKYEVKIDYFKVNVVTPKTAAPDKGTLTPYHPPVPEVTSFNNQLPVAEDAVTDTRYPDLNFNNWAVLEEEGSKNILNVNESQWVILRWDMQEFAEKKAEGAGLLELSTYSLQKNPDYKKDFGMIRVVEILGGDEKWKEEDVTLNKLLLGNPLNEVINSQMIIDVEVIPGEGSKNYITIPQHILQRLIDGKTKGIVLKPLGAVNASFFAKENGKDQLTPKLHFNLKK